MQLAWHIPSDDLSPNRVPASVWIRCLQLIPYLKKLGINSTINEKEASADIAVFVRFQNQDAQRIARQYKDKGKKVVSDFVVNYLEPYTCPIRGEVVGQSHIQEKQAMIQLSDAIFCASEELTSALEEHHTHTICLPDSINTEYFSYKKSYNPTDSLNAIWAGIGAKAFFLNELIPLLKKNGIPLTLITDTPPKFTYKYLFLNRSFLYSYIKWDYDTFPQAMLNGNFALAPRTGRAPYEQGHSSFKIACFLAQGIPVIAAPVPSYIPLLADGKAGRICHTTEEWDLTLSEIKDNPDMLKQWAQNATQAVAHLRTETISQRYLNILTKLLHDR